MSKFSHIAFGATVAVLLLAGGATAASLRQVPHAAAPGGGSDPAICTTLCFAPTDAAIIINKPICRPHTGSMALSRRVIRPCPSSDSAYQACGDRLANLRRVTVGQVRRVEDERVHLVPLCDTVNRTLTEEQTTYLARGNVQGLIPTIGRNDTLMAELEDNGYEANDVIGIALEPDAAVLYVSRR